MRFVAMNAVSYTHLTGGYSCGRGQADPQDGTALRLLLRLGDVCRGRVRSGVLGCIGSRDRIPRGGLQRSRVRCGLISRWLVRRRLASGRAAGGRSTGGNSPAGPRAAAAIGVDKLERRAHIIGPEHRQMINVRRQLNTEYGGRNTPVSGARRHLLPHIKLPQIVVVLLILAGVDRQNAVVRSRPVGLDDGAGDGHGLSLIHILPDGYDTHIEQGGANVSGGQKQRLCIARAILRRPRVLILDDSTSAVDTATDARIRAALRQALPGSTKLIIAQRISSVMDADLIVVLDDGKISGAGTHDRLMATNRIYQEVYKSQQEGATING